MPPLRGGNVTSQVKKEEEDQ